MNKGISIGGIVAIVLVIFLVFAGLDGLFLVKTVNEVKDAEDDKDYRVKGQVTYVSDSAFTIKDKGGDTLIIQLGDNAKPAQDSWVTVMVFKDNSMSYQAKWIWNCLIFK